MYCVHTCQRFRTLVFFNIDICFYSHLILCIFYVSNSNVNIAYSNSIYMCRYSLTSADIDCDGCVWQLVLNEHDDDEESLQKTLK